MSEDYHLSKKDKIASKSRLQMLKNEVMQIKEQIAEEENLAKNDYKFEPIHSMVCLPIGRGVMPIFKSKPKLGANLLDVHVLERELTNQKTQSKLMLNQRKS